MIPVPTRDLLSSMCHRDIYVMLTRLATLTKGETIDTISTSQSPIIGNSSFNSPSPNICSKIVNETAVHLDVVARHDLISSSAKGVIIKRASTYHFVSGICNTFRPCQ